MSLLQRKRRRSRVSRKGAKARRIPAEPIVVIPAKAGTQIFFAGSRFRGDDELIILRAFAPSRETDLFLPYIGKEGANMAGGWTRDGAVQDQIDDTVKDAVLRARALTPQGDSAEECDDCGEPIPKKRREALPGVRTCVACQSERDKAIVHSTINRRGSKDSQLR